MTKTTCFANTDAAKLISTINRVILHSFNLPVLCNDFFSVILTVWI